MCSHRFPQILTEEAIIPEKYLLRYNRSTTDPTIAPFPIYTPKEVRNCFKELFLLIWLDEIIDIFHLSFPAVSEI